MINRCPTKLLQAACAAAALLAFAPNAMAECMGEACENVRIERLFPDANWGTVWVLTDGTENRLRCPPSGEVYLGLREDHGMFNPMYNALLQGLLTQKSMFIRVDPTSSPCVITGVHLNRE